MRVSILKRLQFYMILFGIFMGIVFPVYANFFVVWKEGMFIYFVVGCMFAGITVGVVSFLFVKVILIKKLLEVSDIASDLSHNKVSRKINLQSNDAVGVIVKGINDSISNIRSLIGEVNSTCQISQLLVVRLEKKRTTDVNINNIDNSIEIVKDVTTTISEHSIEIKEAVADSKGVVRNWQEKLAITIENVDKLSKVISFLVQNLSKINGIMSLIDEIASKTNLVSLNASIEASHAGEHGKSFSVVANEIRTLAGSVAHSSSEISEYTNIISGDIKSAEESLRTIEELVSENCNDSREIHGRLKEIDAISHSNLEADKQLVSSVENLNKAFNSIDEVVVGLSENTSKLQDIVSSYEI